MACLSRARALMGIAARIDSTLKLLKNSNACSFLTRLAWCLVQIQSRRDGESVEQVSRHYEDRSLGHKDKQTVSARARERHAIRLHVTLYRVNVICSCTGHVTFPRVSVKGILERDTIIIYS